MNRRNFTKNIGLAGAGLIVAPQTLLRAQPTKEELIIWPWIARLVATAVISEAAKRVVGYVADRITGDDEEPAPQVVHNNQVNYQSVHNYNEQKPDFLVPTVSASPGPVNFYGQDEKQHRHSAALNSPSFAGMTAAVQELGGQPIDRLRDTFLPRFNRSSGGSNGYNVPINTCLYFTQYAKIMITYELLAAEHSQYYTSVEVLPLRPTYHTTDCRFKKRTLHFEELYLLQ